MSLLTRGLGQLLVRFASRLRFPTLFKLVGALFLLNLVIPDFIPLADEIGLGLLTLLLGSWKDEVRTREKPEGRVIDVEAVDVQPTEDGPTQAPPAP